MKRAAARTLTLFLTALLSWTQIQGVRVTVSPDSSQFFRWDSVVLGCPDPDWTLRRNTTKESWTQCGQSWGQQDGSICRFHYIDPMDTGSYWCESRGGGASEHVHISVTDRGVVLRSPVLPVTEGQTVSLSCLHHTSSNLPARFHRDGHFLSDQPTGHMTIQQVSASDEGLYQCEIQGELSESSWIHVRPGKPQTLSPATPTSQAPPSTSQALLFSSRTPPPASGRPLALALLCHLVVFCPYVVSTVLMVSLFRTRTRETDKGLVQAQTGEDVTLTCEAPNVRLTESDGVHWTRPDLEKPYYVLFYRDNQIDTSFQDPRYQTRVWLADIELENGNLSLVLQNVSCNDSGQYECRDIRGGPSHSGRFDGPPIRTVELIVTEPDKPNLAPIIGLPVAAGILVLIVLVIFGYKKRKNLDKTESMTEMIDVLLHL